jgi:serine/threonine protein kinase
VGNRVARTVGRYEIRGELGRGGMATVYLARQADLDRLVALKELSAFRQSDPSFTHRFLRESRLAGSLSHPNIVTVYDYFEADEVPYIAMEYVARGSLRPHVGHMPLTQVAGVLEGILSALHHAEQRHIVHRDLKPENVMVTSEGTVKLTDFGIAKARHFKHDKEGEVLLGKARYMSPEQAQFKVTDRRSDIFAAGIVLHEILSGEALFEGADTIVTLESVVSREIKPLREVAPHVPPEVCRIVDKALERRLDRRYQTAGRMGFELESFMYGNRFGPTNISLHRYLKTLWPDAVSDLIDPSVPDPYFDRLSAGRGS